MEFDEMAEVGTRLRAARERIGMTQAEAAGLAGVKRPAVSNWEAGRSLPNLLQFRSLLTSYGGTAFELLYGSNPFSLTRSEAIELGQAAKGFSPGLQRRMDLMLTVLVQAEDPPRRSLPTR